MPEKLLVPFTNKGKQVSSNFSGSETGTEIHNRRNGLGPTGTGFVTSASIMLSTACGLLKASDKSCVTIAWHRRWCALSEAYGFPTGNGGIS